MAGNSATRAFLLGEVEALQAFDFIVVSVVGAPLDAAEVTRREDQKLEVRVPGRPPPLPELPVPVRSALRDRGFRCENASDQTKPWVREVANDAEAVDLLHAVLAEVFGHKPDLRFDVGHGSHEAEHRAREQLARVRGRVEKVLAAMTGQSVEQDKDADYVLPIDDVHVVVAPRATPGGPVVIRIFAITNVNVPVTPELGIFLARLNFGLMFGRFALDVEHHSIWFDETLLGEQFSDEELRFTIQVVASTADQWDDRLKAMFGGITHQQALKQREAPPNDLTKPGQGLYV